MFGEHFRKWQPTILKWYINIFNLNFFLLYKKSAYDTIYNLKSGFNTITSKYPLGLKWHLHNLSYIVNIRGCKSLSLFFHTLMCLIICGRSTAHLDIPGYVRGRSLHISLQTLVMLVTQEHAMCVCALCVCFRGGRGEEEGAHVARSTWTLLPELSLGAVCPGQCDR